MGYRTISIGIQNFSHYKVGFRSDSPVSSLGTAAIAGNNAADMGSMPVIVIRGRLPVDEVPEGGNSVRGEDKVFMGVNPGIENGDAYGFPCV